MNLFFLKNINDIESTSADVADYSKQSTDVMASGEWKINFGSGSASIQNNSTSDLEKIHKDKKIAVKLVRLKIKDKLLGLSTHNEIEILEANELEIDMIGLGAYKNTNTKDVSTILGSKISYLAKISKHPVRGIGGVKVEDIIENIRFNVVGSGFYED